LIDTEKAICYTTSMFKKNKRKFPRLGAHHLLKYRILESQTAEVSFARNVSAGGVLFYAHENIPVGSAVELTINFPGMVQPVKVQANVLRVKELKKIGGFEVAVQFVNLDEATLSFMNERITKALHRRAKKKRGESLRAPEKGFDVK